MKMVLGIVSTSGSGLAPNLRSELLRRSLRDYCASNRQTLITETAELADTATPVAVLESLSAFARSKYADLTLFDGLINAPEAHLGRNLLICTQPLQMELTSFAARNGVDEAASPMWWKNLLRNFERVIMLDRYSLIQSAGFAPWVPLSLADHFPVLLNRAAALRNTGQVLVFNHVPAAGTEEVLALRDRISSRCKVLVLSNDGARRAALTAIETGAIHIHYGYDSALPTSGLTPLESLANGVYTVILAAPVSKTPARKTGEQPEIVRQAADARIVNEAKARSYALLAEDLDAATEFVDRVLDRLEMLDRAEITFNPEIQRFDRMNEDYISAALGRFAKQVPA